MNERYVSSSSGHDVDNCLAADCKVGDLNKTFSRFEVDKPQRSEDSSSSSLISPDSSNPDDKQSQLGAVVNLFTIVLGAGIVAVPAQSAKTGLVPALAICTISVLVVFWTGVDMAQTYTMWNDAERVKMRRFDDLGSFSYGTASNVLIQVTFIMFLVGMGAVYLLIETAQVQSLLGNFWPDADRWEYRYVLLGVSPVMTTMCMFEDLAALGKVTPFAAMAALCCIACVSLQAFSAYSITADWEDVGAKELRSYVREQPKWGDVFEMLGFTIASFLASFGVNSTFPAVMQEMRKPQEFGRVLAIVMGGVLVLYWLMIISCWLAYGNFTQEDVIQNMQRLPRGPDEASEQPATWTGTEYMTAAMIYNVCMAFNIFVSHPLIQLCCFKTIRGLLPAGWMEPGSATNYFVRIAVQALEISIALIDKRVGPLFGLVAAVCLPLHAVVAPVIFGAKIRSRLGNASRGWTVWIVHVACLIIAVVVWVFGIKAAVAEVASAFV